MPRTRNIVKQSLKKNGKDVKFRVTYTIDRKRSHPKNAIDKMMKEIMDIVQRYDIETLNVLQEHPFMQDETSPPSSPICKTISKLADAAPLGVSTIDLVTPANSDDEGEEDDTLGDAPKKKVSLECDDILSEEEENPIDAIVFNVDNLFHMQARCKLQIDTLFENIKEHREEIKGLKSQFAWRTRVKEAFNNYKGHNCPGVTNCSTCAEYDVAVNRPFTPPTSPPTPPATQEIE